MSNSNQIPLTNIVNVSVSQTATGVNVLNTSNVALFSTDQPTGTFPAAGFGFYVTPGQTQTDWGSSSITYQMANSIFAQQPNILSAGGQLIIVEMLTASETLTYSGVPASGSWVLNYGGNASAAILWNDSAAAAQAKIQAVPGLGGVVVTGTQAGELLTLKLWGVYGASPALVTITSNTLETAGSAGITITAAISVAGESLSTAITRTQGLVNYFGILETATYTQVGSTDFAAAAATVQALQAMYFEVSYTSADITGEFTTIMTALDDQTRCLYYGDSTSLGLNAMLMKAAYVGRLLSVNFGASNTALTAQLKQLVGVVPDPSMTQTIYNNCLTAGVDCYPSFQGFPGISSSGANQFFDYVYNVLAFASALQVAGFNYLAGTATKIPQTEDGMSGLKGAYRAACDQFVANGFLAPGSWTSSTTFGNQQNLLNNISQFGYYIYSTPVALQTQSARTLRQAPLVQVAAKEAGAEHTSNIVVVVNP
jgi:hypothetical protein